MQDLLVGATGFVGGNLLRAHAFAGACHSTDVAKWYGTKPERCVYAGVPAAMYLANAAPAKDLAVMETARETIRRIAPKHLVLISSIAVYPAPQGVDETTVMDADDSGLSAYGRNRLMLERWVREDWPDTQIIRLPALYGHGLKKNFLFDLHTMIPTMLKPDTYHALCAESPLVQSSYHLADNGFYVRTQMGADAKLKAFFCANAFNALCFTDARSTFQFYNLARLWSDLETAMRLGCPVLNLCTPPVSAGEVYRTVTGKSDWQHTIEGKPPFAYDMRSRYAKEMGGDAQYLCTKEAELQDIAAFLRNWREQA